MKRIELDAYGTPEVVARCVDAPDVGRPGPDEVVFDVLAFPVNPADIAFCVGQYRLRPPLPAVPGAECVGRVVEVGSGVEGIQPGDLVINLDRENWAQQRRVPAARVVVLPPDVDILQAAMLRINPPTALLLLSDLVDLPRGAWVLQNTANSAVGGLVTRMARTQGLRTINVVRRREAASDVLTAGGDLCLVDGPDLAARVRKAVGGAPISLALDAVAGEATARLVACVADEATVCVYGAMSGQAPAIPHADLIFRGVNIRGFLLGRFLERRPAEKVRALYDRLAQEIGSSVQAPIDRIYAIEDIGAALVRAQSGRLDGKVLVTPNGPPS